MKEKEEGKFKLFIDNFLVYGVGGIISKLIPFVMIPIITRIMPNTTYFGVSDMANTVLSFTSALAVMGMYDAMYRMFFEKDNEEYKKEVCSTALTFTAISSLIVSVIICCFHRSIASFFFGDEKYQGIVYITAIATLISGTNSIIAAPTRMQNQRKIYLLGNTISPLISYGLALILLLNGHYLLALPLSAAIAAFTMEVTFGILNRKWFEFPHFNKDLLKQLLTIGLPLLPNFLVYWIFNSSDRVMITNLIGIGESGIYAVGSKLGHASQLIYTAFAGGWQYFAFSTMKEDNQVESNSKIFEYLGIISFSVTTFVCAWSYSIFNTLFSGEYIKGFIVAPYLFLAPLLQMLFQVITNQFLVVKKTWPNVFILTSGALVNIVLNFIMIPRIGIEGAAIASLIGYCVSDIICSIVLIKMKLMVISKRFISASIMMTTYFFIWRWFFSKSSGWGSLIAVLFTFIFGYLYRKEIQLIAKKIRKTK
jgi:O-antigen/teichoic acid export membrane protein